MISHETTNEGNVYKIYLSYHACSCLTKHQIEEALIHEIIHAHEYWICVNTNKKSCQGNFEESWDRTPDFLIWSQTR